MGTVPTEVVKVIKESFSLRAEVGKEAKIAARSAEIKWVSIEDVKVYDKTPYHVKVDVTIRAIPKLGQGIWVQANGKYEVDGAEVEFGQGYERRLSRLYPPFVPITIPFDFESQYPMHDFVAKCGVIALFVGPVKGRRVTDEKAF